MDSHTFPNMSLELAFSWIVIFLCLPSRFVAMPAGLALPPGSDEMKTAAACEHQKAYIRCPNIFNGIDIVSAMFGRKNSLECLPPGDTPAPFCSDQEDQIKQQVKDLCQGEGRCEVSASNDFLAMEGTEVCPRVSKYLEVKYRCVPKHTINYDDEEENSNVVTETVGDASIKSSSSSPSATVVLPPPPSSSSPATEILSSSSSPASEVQVLLGSQSQTEDSKKEDANEIVHISTQQSPPESSQEVTESIKNQQSTSDDADVVKETIRKSEITNEKEKEDKNEAHDKDDENSGSVLDDTNAENRNDDKYWR